MPADLSIVAPGKRLQHDRAHCPECDERVTWAVEAVCAAELNRSGRWVKRRAATRLLCLRCLMDGKVTEIAR